ncbi:MAG TPA: hypothetical protein VM492_10275 [Sumerlaeia bacterium]|nr:hypothetical protein [Sumerlaeia bacterium]
MDEQNTIAVTSDELDAILTTLEFYAEDYEHAARKGPLLSPQKRVEYREKARKAENAAARIAAQMERR